METMLKNVMKGSEWNVALKIAIINQHFKPKDFL